MFSARIDLLPRELLVQTSDVDHADWNYRPILGILQRVRFRLVKAVLGDMRGDDLLEVGYGSGVFFPELMKVCPQIAGIDPHDKVSEVVNAIGKAGIQADLRSGSVSAMPFGDDSFDVIVAVSALEYVEDIDAACQEITRVLKPGGVLALVTPSKSPVLDFGLKLLGGEDADSNYGDRRENLTAALDEYFARQDVKNWPPPGIPWLTVYRAMRLVPK